MEESTEMERPQGAVGPTNAQEHAQSKRWSRYARSRRLERATVPNGHGLCDPDRDPPFEQVLDPLFERARQSRPRNW